MRKGLVVTLGVVALFLVASHGFSLAPVISSIPDIQVSDAEQNTATEDRNFFIFSNALDLDELVRDDDTTVSLLKWCFVESTAGNKISLNGLTQYTGTDFRNIPAGSDIRAVNRSVTVRNILWSPTTGSIPFPNPGVASRDDIIQMVVSDGTKIDSQSVVITSVNTPNNASTQPRDRLIPQLVKSWTFATGTDGWTQFLIGPPTANNATLASPAGALTMTEDAAQVIVVFGGWESPKNPAFSLAARWGTVLRARYAVTGSVNGDASPGFRMRAVWAKVTQSGSSWIPDFMSQDTNDDLEVSFFTTSLPPSIGVPGREPGTAGKTYTLLYYPQQIETLMSSSAVVYITFDLLDTDAFGNDAGTLSVNQVDVDVLDRPASSVGTAVPGLSATDFTAWSPSIVSIGTGGVTAGITINRTASSLAITVTASNKLAEASVVGGGATLQSGRYYRTRFTLTSAQASGNIGPHIRGGPLSSRGVWAATKAMRGGGTWSQIGSTPTEFELWYEAPTPYNSTTATENLQIRFETYLDSNPVLVPPTSLVPVAGTLTCTRVETQLMATP